MFLLFFTAFKPEPCNCVDISVYIKSLSPPRVVGLSISWRVLFQWQVFLPVLALTVERCDKLVSIEETGDCRKHIYWDSPICYREPKTSNRSGSSNQRFLVLSVGVRTICIMSLHVMSYHAMSHLVYIIQYMLPVCNASWVVCQEMLLLYSAYWSRLAIRNEIWSSICVKVLQLFFAHSACSYRGDLFVALA